MMTSEDFERDAALAGTPASRAPDPSQWPCEQGKDWLRRASIVSSLSAADARYECEKVAARFAADWDVVSIDTPRDKRQHWATMVLRRRST